MPVNLLLEVGFLGLPREAIGREIREVLPAVGEVLERERLTAARTRLWLSSTRTAFLLEGLPTSQPELVTEIRGPKASQAYDFNQEPTPAASGFAASQGVGMKDLFIKEVDGEKFLFARKLVPGTSIESILPRLAPLIFGTLSWRIPPWAAEAVFPQPPAYFCALLNEKVPPLSLDGMVAGRETGLAEGLGFKRAPLQNASDLPGILAEWGVQALPADRFKLLETQLQSVSHPGGTIRKDRDLLEGVAFGTELPQVFLAEAPGEVSSMPKVLVLEMLAREPEYLPFETPKGELLPVLLGFSTGGQPEKAELELRSTEIKQRLRQLQKDWLEDSEKPLGERVNDTKSLPDPDGIGTLYDFSLRNARRAAQLNKLLDWQVPETILEKAVMIFFAEKAMRLSGCFPALAGTLVPLVAEAQKIDPEITAILKDLASTWDGKGSLPTTQGGILIQLASLMNRFLQAGTAREAFQERIIQLIWPKQLRLDLCKCFRLPEDPPTFDLGSWANLLFKRLQKEGVVRAKSEWVLREGEFDLVAIAGALRTWPDGPPPRYEAIRSLLENLRFRLQQIKIETFKLSEASAPNPALETRLLALEAVPAGDLPSLYSLLLEAEPEIDAALRSLPPVIDERSSGMAATLQILKRAETQMARFPFPSPKPMT